MRYVEKTKTWADNWNDILAFVFFRDDELSRLMLIPEGTTIMQFITKYMIEDVAPDEIITDEAVRVVYYDSDGRDTGNVHVRQRYKEFDIYVKNTELHTESDDRMRKRTHMIAQRLKYLLLRNRTVYQMRFDLEDEFNLWTKVIGYTRYHITFAYKTSA